MIPIISLKKLYHYNLLFNFFTRILIIYTTFSLLTFYLDINIFSYPLSDFDTNRFYGINDPTALTVSRLVYFPLILFSVYFMLNGNKNYLILSVFIVIMILLSLSRTSYVVLALLFILVYFSTKNISFKNIFLFFFIPFFIIILFFLFGLDDTFINNEEEEVHWKS